MEIYQVLRGREKFLMSANHSKNIKLAERKVLTVTLLMEFVPEKTAEMLI